MAASMTIRGLGADDLEAVMAIQGASPEIAQWSLWDYERVTRGEMAGWVAQDSTAEGTSADRCEVVGFLVARRIASDLEVLNLAVRPQMRRRHVGQALLRAAMEWGRSFQAETALLEVRSSNFAALAFYERQGFRLVGKRPNYYTAPVEDALLLIAGVKAQEK